MSKLLYTKMYIKNVNNILKKHHLTKYENQLKN